MTGLVAAEGLVGGEGLVTDGASMGVLGRRWWRGLVVSDRRCEGGGSASAASCEHDEAEGEVLFFGGTGALGAGPLGAGLERVEFGLADGGERGCGAHWGVQCF